MPVGEKLKLPSFLTSLFFVLFCVVSTSCYGYYPYNNNRVEYTYINEAAGPRLTGHVQNWATLIENYILQLASEGLRTEITQSFYDRADYKNETKNGSEIVQRVRNSLGDYFIKKESAAKKLVDNVVEAYDSAYVNFSHRLHKYQDWNLTDLPKEYYKDADLPETLPANMKFSAYFKRGVTKNSSVVKISDEVSRTLKSLVNTTLYTYELEKLFIENARKDSQLRWQYFGSVDGLTRLYPGREWDTNFVGFYKDYDPRIRPWYISATSGPKDVVIVLDCSHSMDGQKFEIAKGVIKTVLNTLTKQDYVNIICARASHWDSEGKWHFFETEVMSCKNDSLVPASTSHRKDLMEKTNNLVAGGTSELKSGFEKAFALLNGKTRTGCQAHIILLTDGKDTDGDHVRCSPGYYTRSGYVPGPLCKYDWKKPWSAVEELNSRASPKARIFSYLTLDEGEEFPGKLACDNRGSFKKLTTGENLIAEMSNYFEFLSKNTLNRERLWTAPYLDAWGLGLMVTVAIPAISNITGGVIGVVGVDATLDEIENIINNELWGKVYAFLIDNEGATIFHPRMKPSSALMEDPMFIPISKLEKDPGFSEVERNMTRAKTGSFRTNTSSPSTYYYSNIQDSVYSFAFKLQDTDLKLRRAVEPKDKSRFSNVTSFFNLLIEYNSPQALKDLPGVFEEANVTDTAEKYPGLRVSYKYSTFRLAPKCYCDPNVFLSDDNLANKTVRAHIFMNNRNIPDIGCPDGIFAKNTRADVLVTSQIEPVWKARNSSLLTDVKWTYIGCRSGVFRTYPGHRSTRPYDPTQRSWYKRIMKNPTKTTLSTAYMDAAGVGKIISISQAIFEGMPSRTASECKPENLKPGQIPAGCECKVDSDCVSNRCYKSMSSKHADHSRCSSEKVEAVTSLDILYNDFHNNVYNIMHDDNIKYSCGEYYRCPDGRLGCQTRCYLFDNSGNVITDPIFLNVSNLHNAAYQNVPLGKKEGEIMHELIYKHSFFVRQEEIEFQGTCSISEPSPKVSLDGLPKTPEDTDNVLKTKGPIPSFSSKYSCIQDVVKYKVNNSMLGLNGMLVGNFTGPCKSGYYYITALPKTNLFLLVVENWKNENEHKKFNFNCKIANRVSATGAFRIINGTCDHRDDKVPLIQLGKCPAIYNVDIKNCKYNTAVLGVSLTFMNLMLPCMLLLQFLYSF